LCGFCKFSQLAEYAAISKNPHALAGGLMLVFQRPFRENEKFSYDFKRPSPHSGPNLLEAISKMYLTADGGVARL
jgi:hypothetical protein